MCHILFINNGEKEIETPKQFREYFGFDALKEKHYNSVEDECCLCQVDLDETFISKNIDYKFVRGDYYVGELNEVKETNCD